MTRRLLSICLGITAHRVGKSVKYPKKRPIITWSCENLNSPDSGMDYSTYVLMNAEAEFKFSCPVCHQHIQMPVTAAGSQIECPTCFREIIVPKSPGGETTKLILRGTQVGTAKTRFQPKPAAPHNGHKAASAKFVAIVTLLVATVVFVIASYAKSHDQQQKTSNNNRPTADWIAKASR